jgi:uncharacterized protein (DUF433 family)
MREVVSLQGIREAISTHTDLGKREHLSAYTLVAIEGTVVLVEDEDLIDLRKRGQLFTSLADIVEPFEIDLGTPFRKARLRVPDLLRPRKHISVDPEVLGGAPVISGTRVPFEMVASLVRDNVPPAEIKHFWPSVSAAAARDAASLADYVDLFDPESIIA